MNYSERGFLSTIPPVVKNLIIINVIMFLAAWVAEATFHTYLNRTLGLFYVGSDYFEPYQIITHMFMHGGFVHLFFNMFALWMFGRVLEQVWGSQRFFIYYFVTGLGAVIIHSLVGYIEVSILRAHMSQEQIDLVLQDGYDLWEQGKTFTNPQMAKLAEILNVPTVGASGAIFGLVMAFGMLFPNTIIMIIFPPIPIKAKYFAVVMLVMGVMMDFKGNVAHFAHLGGMIFGYILIKYWRRKRDVFY